jgi:hypothetical protein
VVEDPFMGDLTIVEKNRATEATLQENRTPVPAQDDYIPGCIVEEIPWPGDDTVCSCDTQAKEAGTTCAKVVVEQREFDVGLGGATGSVDVGGSLHGSLLREEHLALVFDLRGHLSDLEHRARTMGQSMDMLFDAFSNAPAKRKCPLNKLSFTTMSSY